MNITELIKEAFKNISSNKIRSCLTMLGILIGVAAVIAMMSIGEGTENTITDVMSSLGTDTLYLTPGNFSENVRNAKDITNEDVNAILELDCVKNAAPIVSQSLLLSQSNGNTTTATVTGVVPAYESVGNYEMAQGTFISQENLDTRDMVAVIGCDINETLFGYAESPSVGETIRIMGQPYRVIGVLTEKGGSAMGGSQDQSVFIPLTTAQSRLMTRQKNNVSMVAIEVKEGVDLIEAEEQITQLMKERHDIFEGNPNDFSIMNIQEMVDALTDLLGTFTLFLAGVATISLVVGGIGIMNIMLVTVTERTREIGLRKAIGAKNSDIRAQFLVEASVLSLGGGILGVLLGLGISFAVARIATLSGTQLTVHVNPSIILLATVFSTAVGLFFGIYPANKAAQLEPVIALRSE